jgi:outer membrane protein OmpA-like peptidoglycan-associated protein
MKPETDWRLGMMAGGDAGKKFAFGVVAAVVLLLLGADAWRLAGPPGRVASAAVPTVPAVSLQPAATTIVAEVAPLPSGRLLFEPGSDRLPADALELLARISEAARANNGAIVQIAGFYPQEGEAAKNAELANRRIRAARHALEANGVSSARVETGIAAAQPGAEAREAGRVEVKVQ